MPGTGKGHIAWWGRFFMVSPSTEQARIVSRNEIPSSLHCLEPGPGTDGGYLANIQNEVTNWPYRKDKAF